MTILHIIPAEKFTPDFISFMRKNFGVKDHFFLTFGDVAAFPYDKGNDSENISGKRYLSFTVLKKIHKADKIILHGTLGCQFLGLLLQPWAIKKCYWVIWGADLYNDLHANKSIRARFRYFLNKIINPHLKGIITYIKGDYELACKLYKTKHVYYECLFYPSHLHKKNRESKDLNHQKNILVGNSADPTNNHKEAFDLLLPYKDENIRIFSTLSYGGKGHAQYVTKLGRDMFGDKFVPILDFWSQKKYIDFLSKIDIAIFTHRRQQAMGNTITLLGFGKKVYMHEGTPQSNFFKEKGIEVFDSVDFNLDLMSDENIKINKSCINSYFSEKNLVKQWKIIFED